MSIIMPVQALAVEEVAVEVHAIGAPSNFN
jgi:hypothetical protein